MKSDESDTDLAQRRVVTLLRYWLLGGALLAPGAIEALTENALTWATCQWARAYVVTSVTADNVAPVSRGPGRDQPEGG